MGKYSNLWDRGMDGAYVSQRSFIRYAVIATGFALCFVVFITKDNVIRWVSAGFEKKSQQKQIEMLVRQNEELDETIRMMSSNRDTLEKYARERFGFAAPGDDVYIIE